MNPYLRVILAVFLMGSSGAFIKYIALPPVDLTFFRLAIPALFLGIYFAFYLRVNLLRESVGWMLLGSLLNAGRIFLFITSFAYTSIANAIVILYTWPMFATLFGRLFLGEYIPIRNRFLLLMPIIGVAIIFSDQPFSTHDEDLIGMSLMLGSAVLFASTVVIFKKGSSHYSGFETVFFQNVLGGLLYLPFAWQHLGDIDGYTYSIVTVFVLAVGVLAFGMYFQSLKSMKASTISYLSYLEVIIATGYGIVFFDESLTLRFLLGAAFIILSMLFLQKE